MKLIHDMAKTIMSLFIVQFLVEMKANCEAVGTQHIHYGASACNDCPDTGDPTHWSVFPAADFSDLES
jgi:hypothetical protein